MMRAAQQRGIPNVMLNTNGKRIAHDDRFLAELAEVRPNIYFQFDGFESETYRIIRGEPDILPQNSAPSTGWPRSAAPSSWCLPSSAASMSTRSGKSSASASTTRR